MCLNLTQQVRSIATATTAVAKGDLTQRIEIEVEGEMATLKDTVNSMVQQLNNLNAKAGGDQSALVQALMGGQMHGQQAGATENRLTQHGNMDNLIKAATLGLSRDQFEYGKSPDAQTANYVANRQTQLQQQGIIGPPATPFVK